jgi:lipopolysaccharide biosynthesis glycosyltransferase
VATEQDPEPVRVVLAADDNYARPLAVVGRSVIANLDGDRPLEIYVLDNGITELNRRTVMSSLRDRRVEVVWIEDVAKTIADFPTYGFFTTAAYARLLIPDLLPTSVDRVIYLDCDVLVRRSLAALYDLPMGDFAALAVPDMGAPFVACPWGLALWFENGRRAEEFNFNSGVMLINLELWRREGIGETAVDYVRSGKHQYNLDQEALNAVIGTRIGAIDPLWNQQGELFQRECELALPYSREVVQSLKDDPWIIHYSNVDKPWMRDSTHPWTHEWFVYLDQTAFAGWRPPALAGFAKVARGVERAGKKLAHRFGWT